MSGMVLEPDVKGYLWDREQVVGAGHANEHAGGHGGVRRGEEWVQRAAAAAAAAGPGPTLVPGEKPKIG